MSMHTTVTLSEAVTLIAECGDKVSFLLQSDPGIGKSAMLDTLASQIPTHSPRYVEAQTLDLGDVQMPKVNPDSVSFIPNSLFVSDPTTPVIIMLDEMGKAMRPVQNALLRLLHERKLGEYTLPPNSIVFATTNLASDGVGDNLQAHAKNRITTLTVAKPTADEWIVWGGAHGIAPELLAWVHEYPHALASYTDESQADNPYIFNPKKQQAAFVSPRSLEKASHILHKRTAFSPASLISALTGTVGEAAARDMQAFLSLADALPRWERILADPAACPVPDSPIAQSILVHRAIARLDAPSVTPWLAYLTRLPTELQAMFASTVTKSPKMALCVTNTDYTALLRRNAWVF
jgi:hypothetical protein